MNCLPHFVTETESIWDVLQRETRPIALYGMGDGAEKVLRVFEQYGIIAGIYPQGFRMSYGIAVSVL